MKRLGGIPVNRRQRSGFVDQMIDRFAHDPTCILIIAPEGTRRLTGGWKTGFYRIALAAKVPLALGCIDYQQRQAGIIAYIALTGDMETDIATIARHYADRSGKRPKLASPVRWLD